MKQRVPSKNDREDGRRPLQSRSAENLTSTACKLSLVGGHELKVQTGVSRSRSAQELINDSQRDRELQSPSHNSCSSESTRHHPHAGSGGGYGRRAGSHLGPRHRSRSREPPAVERALSLEERARVVERMHREFSGRRKGILNGLPIGCSEEEADTFLEAYYCRTVSTVKERSIRILFPSPEVASEQLLGLNSARYDGFKLSATYGHPDSLLFVGNLACSHTNQDLQRLFRPHGDILRCFVVCSLSTGLSKGYGFVEFSSRDEAAQAKLQLATKVVGQRSLRVDFADNGMQTCDDLQSRTLFVDRLPKGFLEDDVLRNKFSTYGIVNFCQVALTSSGMSRGFAFIDMSTWQEAESTQEHCNRAMLSGHEIRVSFGMPCRPGACILQHKNSINIPFINGRPLAPGALHLCQKENVPVAHPLGDCTHHPPPLIPPYKPHPLHLDVTRPEFVPNPSFAPHGSLPLPASGGGSSTTIAYSSSVPDVSSLPPHSDHITTNTCVTTSLPDKPPQSPENEANSVRHFSELNETSSFHLYFSRKRCAPVLDDAVDTGLMAVYDRPYIGQHQQGIPFTHPLKRIKTSAH